jgi:hypothetical protein
MGIIRDLLLRTGTFSHVDEFYQTAFGPTADQLSAALNEGRSFVNYAGHGGRTSVAFLKQNVI